MSIFGYFGREILKALKRDEKFVFCKRGVQGKDKVPKGQLPAMTQSGFLPKILRQEVRNAFGEIRPSPLVKPDRDYRSSLTRLQPSTIGALFEATEISSTKLRPFPTGVRYEPYGPTHRDFERTSPLPELDIRENGIALACLQQRHFTSQTFFFYYYK